MCLYILTLKGKNNEPKPKTAKKDRIVYKVTEFINSERFVSPFEKFIYKSGKRQKSVKISPSYYNGWKVHKGYHSYKKIRMAVSKAKKMFWWEIDMGKILKHHIGVFLVPTGAKYFLGTDGEIVSSDITYLMPYDEWKKKKHDWKAQRNLQNNSTENAKKCKIR